MKKKPICYIKTGGVNLSKGKYLEHDFFFWSSSNTYLFSAVKVMSRQTELFCCHIYAKAVASQ